MMRLQCYSAVVEASAPNESVADQLQFWYKAATKMEHSKVGTCEVGTREVLILHNL